jgi:hypothetical protein
MREKIALTWESNPGKVSAVQTATIVKHLLTSLTFGKPLKASARRGAVGAAGGGGGDVEFGR